MSELQKGNNHQEQRKKPVALAICFVLLFICLMIIVIIATKNIGLQQQIQRETGEKIVAQYKELDQNLSYMQGQLAMLEGKASSWDKSAKLSSTYAQYVLDDIYHNISVLLGLGLDIKPSEIQEKSTEHLADWNMHQQQLMEELSQSDEITNGAFYKLKELSMQIDSLKDAVAGFNFKLEGNKSAMIRLSAGFDWMEQLQQITEAVKTIQ